MKKNAWESKDENLDNLVKKVFLGKKKQRNVKKKNHFNNSDNKQKEDVKKINEKSPKKRKNSDNNENGYKIIFSEAKEFEVENQNPQNVIQLSKKRKELNITHGQRKISLEIQNNSTPINLKNNKHDNYKEKKKNQKFEDEDQVIKNSNKTSEKIIKDNDANKNKNRISENKDIGSKKEEIKNDISNFQNSKKNENSNEWTEKDLPEKLKRENKTALPSSDNLFLKDFIKLPKEIKAENIFSKSELKTKLDSGNFYPWLSKKSKNLKGMLKLHQEILDFYEFIKPTEQEDEMRHKTVKVIKNLIQTEWPSWTVKEFGSFPNKIHLPDSDVDILVLTNKESNADQHKILKKITDKLVEAKIVDYIQLINARVPIIKATLKETKINLDISANRKNGYEAKKVIKRTLHDFPFMRPIIYVLKYFLRQRKLNESYTGGISSFLLFNLLLAYVQYLSKENNFNEKINLGNILVGFLQFYGFDFNFEDVGISVRYGGYFFKKSDCNSQGFKPNALLSVENFQELDQDIGKSAFKFRKILNCFKQARDALYYPSKIPLESYIGQFIDVDKFLIDRYCNSKKFKH